MDVRLYLLSLNNHLDTMWFHCFLWSDDSFLEHFKLLSLQERCKINYRIPANYIEASSVAGFGEMSIIAKKKKKHTTKKCLLTNKRQKDGLQVYSLVETAADYNARV